MKNYVVTATTSSEQESFPNGNFNEKSEELWRMKYFHVLDTLVVNIKKRFSSESLKMARAIDSFFKLDFFESSFFIEHYEVSDRFIKFSNLLNKNFFLGIS